MSVIFSIIRIANHSGCKIHIQIAYIIAVSFACMWAGQIAHKITVCILHSCRMTKAVGFTNLISQYYLFVLSVASMVLKLCVIVADVIADVSLIAAPMQLWKNLAFSHSRKILVLSAFGASLLITAITIPHSIMLFNPHRRFVLIFGHVKVSTFLSLRPSVAPNPCTGRPQSRHLQPPSDCYIGIPRVVEGNIRSPRVVHIP